MGDLEVLESLLYLKPWLWFECSCMFKEMLWRGNGRVFVRCQVLCSPYLSLVSETTAFDYA
jgi:hypothetical protein